MYPLYTFSSDINSDVRDIPGVWPNKNKIGGRIPSNVSHTLLGRQPHRLPSRSFAGILDSPAFYPWVKGILMEHQWGILDASLNKRGFHAWSPPGSGKTLCGLVWISAAVKQPKVVITRAAARGTWREEIRKYTRFTPVVLSGKTTREIDPNPRAIYITAWETLISWAPALIKMKPHSLVMDEIHWAKNHKRSKMTLLENGEKRFDSLSNTAAAIQALCKVVTRRFGMTATPMPNRTRDLWAQLDLVEPWQWGSFHQFGERYCAGFKDLYGWKYDGLSNEEELLERLAWSRYRTDEKAVAKNLPAKRRQVVYLEKDEQNRPSGFAQDVKRAKGDKESLFEVMLQEAASRKRKYIVDRVKEAAQSGQKVTVFTGRRSDCDKLGKAIKAAVSVPVWCAHGGSTTDVRDKIRHDYMDATTGAVLVGTGDAWGESVNLQDTDLALFVMLPWTPRSVQQWEGRFSRLGQKRPVLISYIVARGTVDEHVADILLDKLPAVGAVTENGVVGEISEAFDGDVDTLLTRIAGIPLDT